MMHMLPVEPGLVKGANKVTGLNFKLAAGEYSCE